MAEDTWKDWKRRLSPNDTITVRRQAEGEVIVREGKLVRGSDELYLGLNSIPGLIAGGYTLTGYKKAMPPKYGEFARAKCGAPGLSLGMIGVETKTYVLYVSSQDNDLHLDEWDPDGDATDPLLPLPSLTELKSARAAMLYSYHRDLTDTSKRLKGAVSVTNGGYPGGVANPRRGSI